MKIMKLLAACAMVGALATTSAMAEEFLGEYDATNNSIAIDLASEAVTTYVSDNNITGDLTVLVTDIETGTIANTNIFQIDQGTLAALDNDGVEGTATAVLKLSADVATDYANIQASTDETASSVYYVRLGGAESGYIEDFFVFTAPKQEEPAPQVVIGNANASTEATPITLNDCTEICKFVNGKNPTYVGNTVDLGTYDTAE